ncbi:hypothetical protein BGZ96_002794 [Linnemannia gamsii]|uniref:Uncharacterized protein n=1 Tax=Linnemannia gamsii TaxID=64522 RepID=A0ABQ7JKD7_9FUNG|nr:hypothetical protein BGZ96_002794 [Linnemannia gamsii]
MIKQVLVALALTAAANASFMHVLLIKDLGFAIHTKGFLAYEGGATVWSNGPDVHATTAYSMTTTFQGIKAHYDKASGNIGLQVHGADWGAYKMKLFKYEGYGKYQYLYVCHTDSNGPNFCSEDRVNYFKDFAVGHIN